MARPRIKIDPVEVEKLASLGLTNREIGIIVGASEATIGRRFASEIDKGRALLNRSLRRKQVEMALGGNVTMLIWLGKNYLGQSDKQDVTITDWRQEVLELVQTGKVTLDDVRLTLGDELYLEFFKSAGVALVEAGQTARAGKDARRADS